MGNYPDETPSHFDLRRASAERKRKRRKAEAARNRAKNAARARRRELERELAEHRRIVQRIRAIPARPVTCKP
jgi:hypothetical protein